MSTSKIVRKTLEEAQGLPRAEIDFSEKNLLHLDDVSIAKFIAAVFDCNDYDYCENPTMFYEILPQMPRLWTMQNVTRLTLAHNKITEIPPAMANLENMEILNLFNNSVEEVPASLSSMPKLRYESENDQLLLLASSSSIAFSLFFQNSESVDEPAAHAAARVRLLSRPRGPRPLL